MPLFNYDTAADLLNKEPICWEKIAEFVHNAKLDSIEVEHRKGERASYENTIRRLEAEITMLKEMLHSAENNSVET
jgi:hypothetical protein